MTCHRFSSRLKCHPRRCFWQHEEGPPPLRRTNAEPLQEDNKDTNRLACLQEFNKETEKAGVLEPRDGQRLALLARIQQRDGKKGWRTCKKTTKRRKKAGVLARRQQRDGKRLACLQEEQRDCKRLAYLKKDNKETDKGWPYFQEFKQRRKKAGVLARRPQRDGKKGWRT